MVKVQRRILPYAAVQMLLRAGQGMPEDQPPLMFGEGCQLVDGPPSLKGGPPFLIVDVEGPTEYVTICDGIRYSIGVVEHIVPRSVIRRVPRRAQGVGAAS